MTTNAKIARRGERWIKKNGPYARELEATLQDLGALATGEEFGYRYSIETKAGRLLLSVQENACEDGAWVAGRFENVDEAVKLLGNGSDANPYTGKWNHHFFSVPIEDAIRSLRYEFSKVLDQPKDQDHAQNSVR